MSIINPKNIDRALTFLLDNKEDLISKKRNFLLCETGNSKIKCNLIDVDVNGNITVFAPCLNMNFELEFMFKKGNKKKGFFWRCEGKEGSRELKINRLYYDKEIFLNLTGTWYQSEIDFINNTNLVPPFRLKSQCRDKLKNDKNKLKRKYEYLPTLAKKQKIIMQSKKHKPLVPIQKSQLDNLIRILELSFDKKIPLRTIKKCLSVGINPELTLIKDSIII